MWVVTAKDETKWLFDSKPERGKFGWLNGGASVELGKFPLNELPSFVQQQQWKDAPIQVKFEIKKK